MSTRATKTSAGSLEDATSLASLRANLLQKLLWVASFLGLITVAPSLYQLFSGGENESSSINILIAMFAILVICAFAPRLPFNVRAFVLILMFFVASMVGLLDFGMISASRPYALVFVVLVGLLYGWRFGLTAILIYVIFAVTIASLIVTDQLQVLPEYYEFNTGFPAWRAYIMNFILTSTLTLLPVTFLISTLESLMRSLEEKVESRTAELVTRNTDLEEALGTVKQLSGMLPICAVCKKVRDDQGYWQQVESYIGRHSEAQFSHGLCPDCSEEMYPGVNDE
jgi:hypothetical protein